MWNLKEFTEVYMHIAVLINIPAIAVDDYFFDTYFQDHQGNNRMVARADGMVVQTSHYYPYGMAFAKGTFVDKQPYQYAANNPVNNLEINGDSNWFTAQYDNSQLTGLTMHVTGKGMILTRKQT